MNLKLLLLVSFLAFPAISICQSETDLNKSDQLGRKQGHWIKKYPGGIVMYDGTFRDNYPEGEFRRYYETGNIRSVLIYSSNGQEAAATIYHSNGYLAAKGKYINQKKEGAWQFFSEFFNGYMVSEDVYSGNLRNGKSVKFYPEVTIAEELNFVNDTAMGEWRKYYPDGTISLRSSNLHGKIDGTFETWFRNGQLHFSGRYKNDMKEGIWLIYNDNGTIRYRMEYINGFTNDRKMDIDDSHYLDSLENNKGKLPDPEKTGAIW